MEPATVVVTLSDRAYAARVMRTIRDVRGPGRYWGPIVWIAIDFDPSKNFCDLYEVTIWRRSRLDTSALDAQLRARPFTGGDGRERIKTIQWSKIHAFDPGFAQWRRAIFMDAGLRVFRSIDPVLAHPWEESIIALDDSHPDDVKRFGCQLETTADPAAFARLVDLVKGDPTHERYFLNCFWIYDTKLGGEQTQQELRALMEQMPVFRTNEMGAMNVHFHLLRRAWRPLTIDRIDEQGEKLPILFDWSERDGRTWRDYVMLKYPTTINFEDT